MTERKTLQQEVATGAAARIKTVLATTPGAPSFDDVLDALKPQQILLKDEAALTDAVRGIEDRLLAGAGRILEDSFRFYEVEEDEVDDEGVPILKGRRPPDEWIQELGEKEATYRWRIARAAQRSTRNAPIGTSLARDIFLGVLSIKAKRQEAEGPRTLNVALTQVNVTAPPQWEEKELIPVKNPRRR